MRRTMRFVFMAEVLLASLSLSPLTLVAAENRGAEFADAGRVRLTGKQQEAAALQRIHAIQQRLDNHLRILQQRVAEAEKVRQSALQKNDLRMLKRAEQLERQAITQYERQVQQIEQASEPERSALHRNAIGPQPYRNMPAPYRNAIGPAPHRSVLAPRTQPPSTRKESQEKKRSSWFQFRLWRPFGGESSR